MGKFFNIAGPCIAKYHYMIPSLSRIGNVQRLIDQQQYFTIRAGRQTGKTTIARDLAIHLNAGTQYYALYCSLESVMEFPDPERGIPVILDCIANALRASDHLQAYAQIFDMADRTKYATEVMACISRLCKAIDRPLAILFDEADCMSDSTLVTFLRQLRNGYIIRDTSPFAQSIALISMRNLRDYKYKVRDNKETLGSVSPFNIIAKDFLLQNFTIAEITNLYAQYTADTGQIFDTQVIDRVFNWSGGQPWLVNALAQEIIDNIVHNDVQQRITPEMVDTAAYTLIVRRDTHIDSLLERLKEPRVQQVVEPLLLGQAHNLDPMSDEFMYVMELGIILNDMGELRFANKIYNEVIARTLNSRTQQAIDKSYTYRWIENGNIQMNDLLREFQSFWRINSEIWVQQYQYREAAPHLILQAFLQRVINGGGQILREFATGRGRADICVVYEQNRYPIELKIYRSETTVSDGILQLAEYMQRMNCSEGWLAVFDTRQNRSWDDKITWHTEIYDNKTIHILGL